MSDYETKYIGSNSQAEKTKAWLDQNFISDPNFPGTIISSIYFDTFDMLYMYEKQESDHIKSKFRIRWYEDLITKNASDICFFEFKHKVGVDRFKKRLKRKNTFSNKTLESPDFYTVMNELRLFDGKILDHVFPSFIVSYTRFRYIIPKTDIRICLDYNIHVPKTNLRLVKTKPMSKYIDQCVFELKGETAVLPQELYHLENLGFKKDSFSKYEQCYNQLLS